MRASNIFNIYSLIFYCRWYWVSFFCLVTQKVEERYGTSWFYIQLTSLNISQNENIVSAHPCLFSSSSLSLPPPCRCIFSSWSSLSHLKKEVSTSMSGQLWVKKKEETWIKKWNWLTKTSKSKGMKEERESGWVMLLMGVSRTLISPLMHIPTSSLSFFLPFPICI